MPTSTDIPAWKSVTTSRGDATSIDRAIKRLDMQNQLGTDAIVDAIGATETSITTINTAITNITNGTTTVSAKWVAYTGPIWLAWWMYSLG